MDMIALILSVIGCINWGLAGLWCITFFFRKAAFRDAA